MIHCVYVLPEGTPPVDGDSLATTTGWNNWSEWVLSRHEEYPEAAHLAQEGWLDEGTPGSLDKLEDELQTMLHSLSDSNLIAITSNLLSALRSKPDGTEGILASDGESGEEDQDEDDNP